MKLFRIKYLKHGVQSVNVVAVSIEKAIEYFKVTKGCEDVISVTLSPDEILMDFTSK